MAHILHLQCICQLDKVLKVWYGGIDIANASLVPDKTCVTGTHWGVGVGAD